MLSSAISADLTAALDDWMTGGIELAQDETTIARTKSRCKSACSLT
jgi:hypothetical protein